MDLSDEDGEPATKKKKPTSGIAGECTYYGVSC